MGLFVWSLAAASSVAFPSIARAEVRSINIPAGPLSGSIRSLSDQTGVSVGFAGPMPSIVTRSVRRAASAAEALRQMLEGSGYRAVATGPSSFRIERVPTPRRAQPSVTPAPHPNPTEPDIVVTARKRSELLSTLPATDHVVRPDRLQAASGIPGSEAIGREIPSVSMSSMGAGRNRLFLRGIGDGPLNGFNQGSVALLLDEARLNYDAPDPDWALVDIGQVEIVEGPQGPLYGTGALGGIVKVSTNRPDLSHSSLRVVASLSDTEDSGVSNSQSVVLNAPVLQGRLGVRAAVYREQLDGWIDNIGSASNANRERLAGGRLALRWSPAERWTVDLAGAIQNRRTRDSQYVDGNRGALERPDRLREPRDLDAKLAMMTVKGPVGGLELASITSLSRQEAVASYDATPLAPALGTIGNTLVEDDRHYRLFDQEVRIANARGHRLEWLAGTSLIQASTDAQIVARDSVRTQPLLTLKRTVTEAALFGEASIAITPELRLGGGARIFSDNIDDEGQEGQSVRKRGLRNIRASGDASLSWTPAAHTTLFLRGATAYRPGGINAEPAASQPAYEADELASLELGVRHQLLRTLSLDATLYAARWQHVQADELLANGLVATRNAGNALNLGLEGDVRWSPGPGFVLSGGFIVQSARLETSGRASGIDDPRLPAVPQAAVRLKADHGFRLGRWDGRAGFGLRYSGATHLSFDPVFDRRTGGHLTIDASLTLSRNGWALGLAGDNLTNSTADVFAFGNPYRVRAEPQRTPARPRTVGITLSRNF